MERCLLTYDLADAEPASREAFNDVMFRMGWREYAEYAPDDFRKLPDTTLIGNFTTAVAIQGALRLAVEAGRKHGSRNLSVKRYMATRYGKIDFSASEKDQETAASKLNRLADTVRAR